MGRRERKKLERRELILARATQAFERFGFEAASVEGIADAADVSLRTLYNFFPNKLDLLLAVSLRAMKGELESALTRLGEPPADVGDGLFAWARAHFKIYAAVDRDLLMRSTLHGVAQGPRRGGGQDYAQFDVFTVSELHRLLEIYIRRGTLAAHTDVDALARLIFAAGYGEFFLWIADPEQSVETPLANMRRHIALAIRT